MNQVEVVLIGELSNQRPLYKLALPLELTREYLPEKTDRCKLTAHLPGSFGHRAQKVVP